MREPSSSAQTTRRDLLIADDAAATLERPAVIHPPPAAILIAAAQQQLHHVEPQQRDLSHSNTDSSSHAYLNALQVSDPASNNASEPSILPTNNSQLNPVIHAATNPSIDPITVASVISSTSGARNHPQNPYTAQNEYTVPRTHPQRVLTTSTAIQHARRVGINTPVESTSVQQTNQQPSTEPSTATSSNTDQAPTIPRNAIERNDSSTTFVEKPPQFGSGHDQTGPETAASRATRHTSVIDHDMNGQPGPSDPNHGNTDDDVLESSDPSSSTDTGSSTRPLVRTNAIRASATTTTTTSNRNLAKGPAPFDANMTSQDLEEYARINDYVRRVLLFRKGVVFKNHDEPDSNNDRLMPEFPLPPLTYSPTRAWLSEPNDHESSAGSSKDVDNTHQQQHENENETNSIDHPSKIVSHASTTQTAATTSNKPTTTDTGGRKMIADWVLGKTIGEGSSGKVKLAYNRITNDVCVVKAVRRPRTDAGKTATVQDIDKMSPESARKVYKRELYMIREAALGTILNHTNIVRLNCAILGENHFYCFYELVPGEDLVDYITRNTKIKEKKARSIFRQIVSAIEYIHRNHIIHRDIKLENIRYDDRTGVAKLLDFGLSAFYVENDLMKTNCGSPCYAAPEIYDAKPYYGPAVDVWSLGVCLFGMLTGSLPFDGSNFKALAQRVRSGKVTYPTYISDEAEHLIRNMLIVAPLRRATISDIIQHPWINQNHDILVYDYVQDTTKSPDPVITPDFAESQRTNNMHECGKVLMKILRENAHKRVMGSGDWFNGSNDTKNDGQQAIASVFATMRGDTSVSSTTDTTKPTTTPTNRGTARKAFVDASGQVIDPPSSDSEDDFDITIRDRGRVWWKHMLRTFGRNQNRIKEFSDAAVMKIRKLKRKSDVGVMGGGSIVVARGQRECDVNDRTSMQHENQQQDEPDHIVGTHQQTKASVSSLVDHTERPCHGRKGLSTTVLTTHHAETAPRSHGKRLVSISARSPDDEEVQETYRIRPHTIQDNVVDESVPQPTSHSRKIVTMFGPLSTKAKRTPSNTPKLKTNLVKRFRKFTTAIGLRPLLTRLFHRRVATAAAFTANVDDVDDGTTTAVSSPRSSGSRRHQKSIEIHTNAGTRTDGTYDGGVPLPPIHDRAQTEANDEVDEMRSRGAQVSAMFSASPALPASAVRPHVGIPALGGLPGRRPWFPNLRIGRRQG